MKNIFILIIFLLLPSFVHGQIEVIVESPQKCMRRIGNHQPRQSELIGTIQNGTIRVYVTKEPIECVHAYVRDRNMVVFSGEQIKLSTIIHEAFHLSLDGATKINRFNEEKIAHKLDDIFVELVKLIYIKNGLYGS